MDLLSGQTGKSVADSQRSFNSVFGVEDLDLARKKDCPFSIFELQSSFGIQVELIYNILC